MSSTSGSSSSIRALQQVGEQVVAGLVAAPVDLLGEVVLELVDATLGRDAGRRVEMFVPMPAIESSDHRLKSASRSSGTLSAWAMTSTGSGTAKSRDELDRAPSIHESISLTVTRRITGSSAAIDLWV